jgi:hypothetical protein
MAEVIRAVLVAAVAIAALYILGHDGIAIVQLVIKALLHR